MALAAVPFALLVWRFDYLNDDALINFRYSRNLARGLGLRFNADDAQPVEAYNLLWTLLMAIPERLGWNAPECSRLFTIASGLALITYVAATAQRTSDWARRASR